MRKTLSANQAKYRRFASTTNYDPIKEELAIKREKEKKALVTILTNAINVEDAKNLMEAVGYLPYATYTRNNNRVSKASTTSTNGYLESIGRL